MIILRLPYQACLNDNIPSITNSKLRVHMRNGDTFGLELFTVFIDRSIIVIARSNKRSSSRSSKVGTSMVLQKNTCYMDLNVSIIYRHALKNYIVITMFEYALNTVKSPSNQ